MERPSYTIGTLFRDASILLSGNVGSGIFALLQSVILARALGPADVGVWAIVISAAAFTLMLLSFRTSEALSRSLTHARLASNDAEVRLLVSVSTAIEIAVRLLVCILLFLAAPYLAQQFTGADSFAPLFRIYAISVVPGAFDPILYSLSRDSGKFALIAAFQARVAALRTAMIALLWQGGILTLEAAAWAMIFVSVLQAATAAGLIDSLLKDFYRTAVRLLPLPSWTLVKRLPADYRSLMLNGYLSNSFNIVVKNGDVLVLGWFTGNHIVGLYRIASSLLGVFQTVAMNLGTVAYQNFNETSARYSPREAISALYPVMRVWVPGVLVAFAAAYLLAPPLIPLCFGTPFTEATAPFRYLLVGHLIPIVFFWAQPLLLSYGGFRELLVISAINAVFFIGGATIFAPTEGITAISILRGATWSLGCVLALAALRHIAVRRDPA